MIIKDVKVRSFLAKLCIGSKKKKYWINTDLDRTLPHISTATLDNCPVGDAPPEQPLSTTISIFTEWHEIRFEAGSLVPTKKDIYGSTDDSNGDFIAQYPQRGLIAIKLLEANYHRTCINPTWRDTERIDMMGTLLVRAYGVSPYKIREDDTYYLDWYDFLGGN